MHSSYITSCTFFSKKSLLGLIIKDGDYFIRIDPFFNQFQPLQVIKILKSKPALKLEPSRKIPIGKYLNCAYETLRFPVHLFDINSQFWCRVFCLTLFETIFSQSTHWVSSISCTTRTLTHITLQILWNLCPRVLASPVAPSPALPWLSFRTRQYLECVRSPLSSGPFLQLYDWAQVTRVVSPLVSVVFVFFGLWSVFRGNFNNLNLSFRQLKYRYLQRYLSIERIVTVFNSQRVPLNTLHFVLWH